MLGDVVARVRSSFGASLRVLHEGHGRVSLQVGEAEGAIVGLRVEDIARPSFAVTYPELKIGGDGARYVDDVSGDGVLFEGVEWIVAQLVQHGVVIPEYLPAPR